MRLDKFLKVSRLIKRRSVAKDACEGGRVQVNGQLAKPGKDVVPGDHLEITYGNRVLEVRVLETPHHVRAKCAPTLYEVIREDYQTPEDDLFAW